MTMPFPEGTIPVFTVDRPGASPGSNTVCNGCGGCCEILSLQGKPDSYRYVLETPALAERLTETNRANMEFALRHLHPISVALAARINPRKAWQDVHGNFYLCDRYDVTAKRCMAYDERPPMCTGFPRYGLPLTDEQFAAGLAPYAQCSFWNDVPRELWPDYVDPLPSPSGEARPPGAAGGDGSPSPPPVSVC